MNGSSTSPPPISASAATVDEETLCGICFTDVDPLHNPRGALNSCKHLFCFYCISTWAKDTNVCPHCKARFTKITTVDPVTFEESHTKVRKKNFKGWEDESDDDDDESNGGGLTPRTGRMPVQCRVCNSAENATRLVFCDRRTCDYVAHLDCIGLRETPQTFVCAMCATPTGVNHQDMALALQLELASRVVPQEHEVLAAPTAARNTPSATGRATAARPLTPPSPPPQVAAADDNVPYYLRGPAADQAAIARQQLQSKLESSRCAKVLRSTQLGAKRARQEQQHQQQTHVAAAAPPTSETMEQMDRRLLSSYFLEQLPLARRRHYINSNRLQLSGDGHIKVSAPCLRVEEVAREEMLRTEAMTIARKMTDHQMEQVRAARKEQARREAERNAVREAHALAKLAEIIRNGRERAATSIAPGAQSATTAPMPLSQFLSKKREVESVHQAISKAPVKQEKVER